MHIIFEKLITRHFADDTCLMFHNKKIKSIETVVNYELKKLVQWLKANKLSLNKIKTEMIIFHAFSKWLPTGFWIKINKHKLIPSSYVKYLGLYIDDTLSWKYYINILSNKLCMANGIISKLRHFVTIETCISIYYAIFHSHIVYGSLVWQFTTSDNLEKINVLQKKCIRLLTFSDFNAHSNNLFFNLDLLKLEDVLEYSVIIFFFNLYKGRIPNVLSTNFKARNSIHSYPTRSSNCLDRRPVKTTRYGINSISYRGVSMWNEFCKRTFNLDRILSNNNIKSNLKKQFLLSYKSDMN